LWRGSPGWFFNSVGNRSSGGGSGTIFSESFAFGKIQLNYSFDYSTRTAMILRKRTN
jgi:hypothetical protein